MKLHAGHIEVSVAIYFGVRQNLIVPNVSWGLDFGHEIDLLKVSQSGYATEIEIKVSKQDIIRDKSKGKWMGHSYGLGKIKMMYFAVPKSLKDFALEHIPKECGLLTVSEDNIHTVNQVKAPEVKKNTRKLTDKELLKLATLGTMRIWSLKSCLFRKKESTNAKED